jgi:hypothetical protein
MSSPRACSGDMYDSVPSVCPISVACCASRVSPVSMSAVAGDSPSFARPKSTIFTWPRSVTKMFADLMSR